MTVVLCAPGTPSPEGRAALEALADSVGPATVVTGVDGLGDVPSRATVVPLLVAPSLRLVDALEAAARTGVRLTGALGPDPLLTDLLADRLRSPGLRATDQVVLASDSSDARSATAVRTTAAELRRRLGRPVHVAHGGRRAPAVADMVATLRRQDPRRRVVVAAYELLAGDVHAAAASAGADLVTAPLVTGDVPDERLVRLVRDRVGPESEPSAA